MLVFRVRAVDLLPHHWTPYPSFDLRIVLVKFLRFELSNKCLENPTQIRTSLVACFQHLVANSLQILLDVLQDILQENVALVPLKHVAGMMRINTFATVAVCKGNMMWEMIGKRLR
jgi:hypothetical protein